MLEVIRDVDGSIKAVCEFITVDEGSRYTEDGERMYILELEVAPRYRNNGVIKQVIKNILKRCPSARMCGWVREYKYRGRPMVLHTRSYFEKLVKEV